MSVGLFFERYDDFARVPWLRVLSLHDMNNSLLREFLNRPWNLRWVELELEQDGWVPHYLGYDGTPGIIALAASPQVVQLRRLELHRFTLGPVADEILASLRERFGDRLRIVR